MVYKPQKYDVRKLYCVVPTELFKALEKHELLTGIDNLITELLSEHIMKIEQSEDDEY